MHEDSMKKLQGNCVSWLVYLTGAAQLLLVCGEGMFYLCMISASNIHYWIPSQSLFHTEIAICFDLNLTNGNIVYTAGSPDNRPIFSGATSHVQSWLHSRWR